MLLSIFDFSPPGKLIPLKKCVFFTIGGDKRELTLVMFYVGASYPASILIEYGCLIDGLLLERDRSLEPCLLRMAAFERGDITFFLKPGDSSTEVRLT